MKKGAGGKIIADGHSFPNARAFQVYKGLKKLQETGRVERLSVNEEFPLVVNQVEVGTLTITFRFVDLILNQQRWIVMSGGPSNALREFKIRCFEAQYELTVEVWG